MSPGQWQRWRRGCSEGRRPGQSPNPLKEMDQLDPKINHFIIIVVL